MWRCLAAVSVAAVPASAVAQTSKATLSGVLNSWDSSPAIVIPTVLVLAIYGVGLARRPGALDERFWRHVAFFWGVFLTYLSLASPLDGLADHLFFMHQIQHMLIRVIGPMLVALSQPQGLLVAGLPTWFRRRVLSPVVASRVTRSIFGFLSHPAMATALFIASLYVWQWPALHNTAILNEGVHDSMHVTMLMAGLFFFWRVFDQRPAPKGTGFGVRLMMIWVAVLANIPIGAFITFKSSELYPAYDIVGRLLNISPMADERLGGFIMWAPSSMMMLFAVLVVIHLWGRHEERVDDQRVKAAASGPPAVPQTAANLIASRKRSNRALALGLAGFSLCMLGAALTIGFLVVYGRASVTNELASSTRAAITAAARGAPATRD